MTDRSLVPRRSGLERSASPLALERWEWVKGHLTDGDQLLAVRWDDRARPTVRPSEDVQTAWLLRLFEQPDLLLVRGNPWATLSHGRRNTFLPPRRDQLVAVSVECAEEVVKDLDIRIHNLTVSLLDVLTTREFMDKLTVNMFFHDPEGRMPHLESVSFGLYKDLLAMEREVQTRQYETLGVATLDPDQMGGQFRRTEAGLKWSKGRPQLGLLRHLKADLKRDLVTALAHNPPLGLWLVTDDQGMIADGEINILIDGSPRTISHVQRVLRVLGQPAPFAIHGNPFDYRPSRIPWPSRAPHSQANVIDLSDFTTTFTRSRAPEPASQVLWDMEQSHDPYLVAAVQAFAQHVRSYQTAWGPKIPAIKAVFADAIENGSFRDLMMRWAQQLRDQERNLGRQSRPAIDRGQQPGHRPQSGQDRGLR